MKQPLLRSRAMKRIQLELSLAMAISFLGACSSSNNNGGVGGAGGSSVGGHDAGTGTGGVGTGGKDGGTGGIVGTGGAGVGGRLDAGLDVPADTNSDGPGDAAIPATFTQV